MARRIHSFIWPTLWLVFWGYIAIKFLIEKNTEDFGISLFLGICGFTFIACMILGNTFISDTWFTIASWGFVKFPGIIFEFTIDGFIFLIAMKVLFWALGIIIALAVMIIATIICSILSVFAYPFAIVKNFKNPENI